MGSFYILKDVVLEEQPNLAMALSGGEHISNAPTKAEMDKCTKALATFNSEVKAKTKELQDAKAKN